MFDLGLIRNNLQFYLLLLVFFISGAYAGLAYLGVISFILLILWRNERPAELFIGFLFILILSDSLELKAKFAAQYKNIYILILFVFFLIDLKRDRFVISFYKYFVPYFLIGLICLIFSPVVSTSAQKLISYIILFIITPNYVYNAYRSKGAIFFKELIYFFLLIVIIGYLLRFYAFDVAVSHGGRLRGIFGNPNGLGIFLILIHLIFVVVYNKFDDLFTRNEKLLFHAIILFVVLGSGSRTALGAILLFHAFTSVFKVSYLLGFILFGVIMLFTDVIVAYLPQIIIALDLQESFRIETLQEGSGRTIAWQFAWENIKSSMLFGKGFAYDEFLMRANFDYLSRLGHQGGVHNTYLIMWLNTGLIGLVFFLRGFFLVFIQCAKYSKYAFPAMLAIMLSINFEPWLAASLNPFTILFLTLVTIFCLEMFTENSSDENEIVA